MANVAELIIRLEGQDKVSGVLKGVKEETGGLGKSLGDVTKIATGFMAAQGAGALVGFLGSAANAAAEDAASVERLKTAYENANGPAATFTTWMESAVQSGQDLAFSDDQIRDSLSLLTAQTSSAEEAQKRLGLAQDLSRGANIDLVTASKLLGKVTDENVNVLSRYGIAAKEGMTQSELFGMIQEKFGGQAQTFADSTAGGMERAKIKMAELKESIGYALLPVLTTLVTVVTDQLMPAISSFFEIGKKVFDFLNNNKAVLAAIAAGIVAVMVPGIVAWTTATWAHVTALWAQATAMIAANAPLIAAGLAIAAVVAGIVLLVQHWDDITSAFSKLPGMFLDAWNQVTGFFTETVPKWIKDNWPQILIGVFTGIPGLVLFHFRDKLWEIAQTDVLPFFTSTIPTWIKDNWPSILVFALLNVPGLVLFHFKDKLWAVFQSDVLPLFTETIPNWFRDNWVPIVVTVLTGGAGTMIYAFRDTIATKASEIGGALLSAAAGMGNKIRDGLVGGIKGTLGAIGDIKTQLWQAIKGIINSAIDAINDAIPDEIKISIPLAPDIVIDLPDNPIPRLAKGGIVLRPTLAVLGERPEAVIPLDRAGPVTAFQPATVVNLNVDVLTGDRASVERLVRHLQDYFVLRSELG